MTQLSKEERRRLVVQQAASWLTELESDLSPEARSQFIDWLRESPLHVSEMLHACRLQRDLRAFEHWQRIEPAGEVLPEQVLRLTPPAARSKSCRRPLMLAAACTLLVALLSLFLLRTTESRWETQLGERREVTLGDGSLVDLAPGSELRVRLSSSKRFIVLERGEALFRVTKDPNRPFIVEAAGAQVRAVGTVFDVEHKDLGVSVTVVEGRVTVSDQRRNVPQLDASANVSLGVDEQLLLPAGGHAAPIRKVKAEMETAWAVGQLMFDDETVAEVVRRFNLYNRTQLSIADEALSKRRIGGVFRATDPESFVAFLESAGGVQISRPTKDVIVLGRN